jgi:hypothetical protein
VLPRHFEAMPWLSTFNLGIRIESAKNEDMLTCHLAHCLA